MRTVFTSEAEGLAWTMTDVPTGEYCIEAGTDRDFDGEMGDLGEVFGEWRDASLNAVLLVLDDSALVGLDFAISPR